MLREKWRKPVKKRNIELFLPDKKYCGDNAAMIGSQGYYEFKTGNIADLNLNAFATMAIDTLNR